MDCSRPWTLPSPIPGPRPASASRGALGVDAVAAVGDAQRDVVAEVDALDRHQAALGLALHPVADRVLHQRLQREHRQHRLQHLGVDLDAHRQPLAEPRLLEPQVLLHVAQLVGDRHVRALARERVADELGELGQQLARLLRARVDERGDGGERVVDEVRRDLGPQRAQLGAREPLALRLHLAQLDHRRHQRRRLADHARLLQPQPAGPVVERDERADAAVAHHERRDDRRAQRAARLLAVQARLDPHAVVAHLAGQRGQAVAGVVVVGAEAVEHEQLARRRRARPPPLRSASAGAARRPRRRARGRGAGAAAATWRRARRPASPSSTGPARAARARDASPRPARPRAPVPGAHPARRPPSPPSIDTSCRPDGPPFVVPQTPFVAQIDL